MNLFKTEKTFHSLKIWSDVYSRIMSQSFRPQPVDDDSHKISQKRTMLLTAKAHRTA